MCTILREFGGTDLCLDKEVVPRTEHLTTNTLCVPGVIDAGQGRILVRSTRSLLVLHKKVEKKKYIYI